MTAKAGVVGWPIEHSLSPVLHGYWLREYGIDGSYEKIAIEPDTFRQRITDLRAAGYRGVNVTVPHKEAAFAVAHELDKGARICGAVNLLVFNGDKIEGRNTDHSGLHVSILKAMDGNPFKGKTAVLLGAGGAARGAILALDSFGFSQIHILNRDEARAKTLAANLATEIEATLVGGGLVDWKSSAGNAALIINSTSAGMGANPPLDIDLAALPKDAAVCDIVYSPLETKLLRDAAARGHKTIDGLGMLMHQAVPSFEAFFGTRPQVTHALREALVKVLRERQ